MNKKKIALITGANKGIGLETARQLGEQDITVLLGARDSQERGKLPAEGLRKDGIDAHPIVIDVSDPESIRKAANQVERDFGRLDILINNAGVMTDERTKKVSEQSLDTWRETFDTNVFGLIATTNAFLPLLRKSEGVASLIFRAFLDRSSSTPSPALRFTKARTRRLTTSQRPRSTPIPCSSPTS